MEPKIPTPNNLQKALPPELEQAEDQLVESLALAYAAIARELYAQEQRAAEERRESG